MRANNSSKTFVGRAAKAAASISALVVGAIVHGVVSLERMVAVVKLKEGLDVQLFIRSARSSSHGMSRSFRTFKIDHCIEVSVHWFRVIGNCRTVFDGLGNCRTVFDGLVAEILGEPYTSVLSRMQRMLPLNLVFPPAYGMVIWRPYILNSNIATREDIQLYQHLSMVVGDAIKHQPFRDLCLFWRCYQWLRSPCCRIQNGFFFLAMMSFWDANPSGSDSLKSLSSEVFQLNLSFGNHGVGHVLMQIYLRTKASIEEEEVVDEGVDIKRPGRMSFQLFDAEGFSPGQQYITDRALAELVLPCIDRSSSDSRNSFATELIKQLNTIEQQINMLTRSGGKQSGSASSAVEVSSSKSSSRKGLRGGSPGLGRRPTSVTESSPPSAAALRASMWLRLQFLLRLLPIICADREQSTRNMRHTLAAVILRLLGTRVVQEDADACHLITHKTPRREEEYIVNAPITASLDLSGDSLFDRFLCVLHGLLGNFKPSWLKAKSISKSTVKSRDFSVVDREVVEKLQGELDRMELPAAIRRRLQAAMPVLPPSPPLTISCNPPLLTSTALTSLQPGISSAGLHQANSVPNQRTSIPPARPASTIPGKGRASLSQDLDMEIDPWTLLEDGTGTASAPSNSSSNAGGSGVDHSNLKACSWLKGAVRVRRTDLTYIGAMDDDS